ncbi:MAG: hypothetical protein CYG60_16565 [Actinobacteria bacterium]|nr:MAG: hypothetical protein CYG60_16565 [Actinomycetota bacterium]
MSDTLRREVPPRRPFIRDKMPNSREYKELEGLASNLLYRCSAHKYNAGMRAHTLSPKEDRAGSVAWAKELLRSRQFCVLDSETTGLKPPVGFVEVAVVDADARTLFEGTVRPVCPIEPGATRVHGYTAKSLAESPSFREVYPDLLEALWGKRVVVYNAPYDRRVWDTEVRGLGARGALAGELPPGSAP